MVIGSNGRWTHFVMRKLENGFQFPKISTSSTLLEWDHLDSALSIASATSSARLQHDASLTAMTNRSIFLPLFASPSGKGRRIRVVK